MKALRKFRMLALVAFVASAGFATSVVLRAEGALYCDNADPGDFVFFLPEASSCASAAGGACAMCYNRPATDFDITVGICNLPDLVTGHSELLEG